MNFLVLINLEKKLPINKRFTQIRKIHADLGIKVNNQTPTKIKIPLNKPIISEILLPFLKPKIPPTINKIP